MSEDSPEYFVVALPDKLSEKISVENVSYYEAKMAELRVYFGKICCLPSEIATDINKDQLGKVMRN